MSSWDSLTKEQLENLPTKRLMNVYDLARKRAWYVPTYSCGSPSCNDYADEEYLQEKEQQEEYRLLVKSILDTREHIEDKK